MAYKTAQAYKAIWGWGTPQQGERGGFNSHGTAKTWMKSTNKPLPHMVMTDFGNTVGVYQQQQLPGAGGAGVGSGGAMNAYSPQLTGGGDGLGLGAVNVQEVSIGVADEFAGLNLNAASTKIPSNMTPDAMNVDGIGTAGGLRIRPGLLPTTNATAIRPGTGTTYKGRSICALSQVQYQDGIYPTFIISHDKSSSNDSLGDSTSATSTTVVRLTGEAFPGARYVPLSDPPIILLTATGGGGVSINANMPSRYRNKAVERILIRSSTVNYPTDPYGSDDRSGDNAFAKDSLFNGTSTAYTNTGAPTGVRYYSVWAIGRMDMSPAANQKVTVT